MYLFLSESFIPYVCAPAADVDIWIAEKVWIVWSTSTTKTPGRFQSPVYLSCIITIALYLVVGVLAITYRIAKIREVDHVCIIGLGPLASLAMLCYDV